MNRLVILLLTVCVMLVVEGSMEEIFKVNLWILTNISGHAMIH